MTEHAPLLSLPILTHRPSHRDHLGAMTSPDAAIPSPSLSLPLSTPSSPALASPKRKRDDLIREQRTAAAAKFRDLPASVFSFQPPDTAAAAGGTWSPRARVAAQLKCLALGGDASGSPAGSAGTGYFAGSPRQSPGPSPSHSRRGSSFQAAPRTVLRTKADGAGNTAAARDEETKDGGSDGGAVFDFSGRSGSGEVMDHDGRGDYDQDAEAARKRLKQFVAESESESESAAAQASSGPSPSTTRDPEDTPASPSPLEERGRGAAATTPPPQSPPGIGGAAESSPESGPQSPATPTALPVRRKRTGTPPASASRNKASGGGGGARSSSSAGSCNDDDDDDDELVIVDPVRAALTWHEDEITIYDPEDQDDDGTGVNGIGFKPSPAVAYRRALTRRQQLADYRRREASEARRQRNERRREQVSGGGGGGGGPQLQRRHSMVHVHFSEAEPATVSVA